MCIKNFLSDHTIKFLSLSPSLMNKLTLFKI